MLRDIWQFYTDVLEVDGLGAFDLLSLGNMLYRAQYGRPPYYRQVIVEYLAAGPRGSVFNKRYTKYLRDHYAVIAPSKNAFFLCCAMPRECLWSSETLIKSAWRESLREVVKESEVQLCLPL